MHEHLAQQLNLTPEQKAQFDAIHAKAAEQRRAIMSEAQQDRDAARERLKALRDDTQRQVDAILTPEQKVKADELRAKAKSFEGKRPKRLGEKMKQRRERRDVQN